MPDPPAPLAVDLGDGVRVEWDPERLAGLAGAGPSSPKEPPWRLGGDSPNWKRWRSMQVLSAAFEDRALVAFAALRPRKAKGHDEDSAGALLVREGAPVRFEDFLLSVQFDGTGELRRANVEAYLDADAVPMRLSGDVVSRESRSIGVGAMEANVLEAHLNGRAGFATLDLLGPA